MIGKVRSFLITNKFHNTEAFTLIEIIITISIIAIAAGLSGFGINVLFQANVASMGNDIYHDLRDIRYRTVSEYDTEYQMVMTYDTTTGRYGYIIEKRHEDTSVSPSVVTKEIIKEASYRSTLWIERWDDSVGTSGGWVDIKDASLDIGLHPEKVTFPFKPSTGGIATNSLTTGLPIGSLVSNVPGTAGRYRIVSSKSTDVIVLTIVGKTGRVVKYE